jgi:hypothetical protein
MAVRRTTRAISAGMSGILYTIELEHREDLNVHCSIAHLDDALDSLLAQPGRSDRGVVTDSIGQ